MIILFFSLPQLCLAQTENCSIIKTNCPPFDLAPACANTVVGGIFGAYVYWTPPAFSLSCPGGEGEGYAFYMSFDLPEVQNGCWLYSKVQRTGTGGGRLRLDQSVQTNGNPNPNFTTPSFFLPSPPTNGSMRITNGSGNALVCNIYLVFPDGSLSAVKASFPVSGTGDYLFSITPPQAGVYRLFFEFTGNAKNTDYIELIKLNALLYGSTCAADINFFTVANNTPGNFFPVGSTPVTYTATCNSCVPVLSETCTFNVIVNGVTASANTTGAFCGVDNGTITLTATSSNPAPAFQYNLNNSGWVDFTSPATITGLAAGPKQINVRDYFTNISNYCQVLAPVTANVITINDAVNPSITCPPELNVDGCGPDAITVGNSGLVYSSALRDITFEQFTAADASATDNCLVVSWKYQDSQSGICPLIVTRTFYVTDGAGNTASCTQNITISENQPPELTLEDKSFCVELITDAIIDEPTVDIINDRPEWYLFRSGSDILDPFDYSDNCTSDSDLAFRWRIDFSDGSSLSGNGKLSAYGSDIQFEGDENDSVTHHLTYWVTDLCGNETERQSTIIIHPRPEIIKQTQ